MELLAPAGNTENFLAAIDAGADAVYVGAPGFNARNLARDLRLEDILAMVRHCHDLGKKIYLAANSLIREQDLSQVLETLTLLEAMETDGLIVQDLGLVKLIKEFFPSIPLHASTLLAANNSVALRGFQEMGFERVVLARELTLKEISSLCQKSDIEIEVFVHGAMCFSYSGLCLFSSFLGGKSGLRGKCVQPCRRHYHWSTKKGEKSHGQKTKAKEGKGQYLFSMNDLSALQAVPDLQAAGVTSLKIEGRLRSAHYVSHIVQAYRLVMDAGPDTFAKALQEATALSDRAMGRKTASGYLFTPQPADAITPYHSGNMGDHLGRLGAIKTYEGKQYARLSLKGTLGQGDRLRFHGEPSGERLSFTLKELRMGNNEVQIAAAGEKVQILVPDWEYYSSSRHIDVYRVDVKKETVSVPRSLQHVETGRKVLDDVREKNRERLQSIKRIVCPPESDMLSPRTQEIKVKTTPFTNTQGNKIKLPLDCWLRLDSAKTLFSKLPFNPDRYLLPITKYNLSQTGQLKRFLGKRSRDLTWCLPAIIFEGELPRVTKQIQSLIRSGFRSFQLGHISQLVFFGKEHVFLSCDYTVNLLNSQAVAMVENGRIKEAQLSIESDKGIIRDIVAISRQNNFTIRLGLTVYGAPALFTARLDADHFQYNKTVNSPHDEQFVLLKKENVTTTIPVRPFSLLPYLHELKALGLDYVVIDMSNIPAEKKEMEELEGRLSGKGRYAKLPTFNYLGTLE
ncbi:MAG: U32 family peptidase [Proteobacteria bacterium]|nr:U32 family peptidase [Pseudomonadota bacterium]MBU1059402.1 U32 family peptidase [Pseudomonadota bacterium]